MNHCEKHLTSGYRLFYGSVGFWGLLWTTKMSFHHWEECWPKMKRFIHSKISRISVQQRSRTKWTHCSRGTDVFKM